MGDYLIMTDNTDVLKILDDVKDMGDLYYVALLTLYKLKDNSKYSTLAEMSFLLEPQSFINMIWHYEGQTIQIPSRDELKSSLRMISLYYYYDVKELSWHDALNKIGFDPETESSSSFKFKLNWFRKALCSSKLPIALKNSDNIGGDETYEESDSTN